MDNSYPINNSIPYRDWFPIIRSKIFHKWRDDWHATESNKVRDIKDDVRVWSSSLQRNRKLSIILTRLRIGHTKLTHQYLMENRQQPYCSDCIVPLTVKHVLAECPSHSDIREQMFPETVNGAMMLTSC